MSRIEVAATARVIRGRGAAIATARAEIDDLTVRYTLRDGGVVPAAAAIDTLKSFLRVCETANQLDATA